MSAGIIALQGGEDVNLLRPTAEEQSEIDENSRNYRALDRVYHAQRAEDHREKRRERAIQKRQRIRA